MTSSKLPFELSPDAVSSWLDSLNQNNNATSAIELNDVAKLLRRHKTDANEVLSALLLLTPAILHISNAVETSCLAEQGDELATPKLVRLCSQLLRNTGLAFSNISDENVLSADEQNLAIYTTLQLIGYSQRLSALFHQPPSSTLWGEIGKVYNLAQKANNTQREIDHKNTLFKNQATIESVLKRNILFYISRPYQHAAEQIKTLFLMSEQLADRLLLNPSYSSVSNAFHWDSTGKNAPSTLSNCHQKKQFNTAINTGELIAFMQSAAFSCPLKNPVLTDLIDRLSAFHSIINRPIHSAPTIANLLIGFNEITEYLTKADKLKKIQQLSTQSTADKPVDKLGIVAISFENNLTIKPATSVSNFNLLTETRAVKTLQVNHDNYIIAETNYFECSIGDITLFCAPNFNHKLGIIRQVKITNSSKTLHILIEEIAGAPSMHLISSPQVAERQMLSIQTAESGLDLFIPPCKLSNGSQLTCSAGEEFTITKLVDYTLAFNRYQTAT